MDSLKIVSPEKLKRIVAGLKKKKKKIIQAHGVFDILHAGHIHYLEEAKKLGDVLIVTVNADAFVNKGPRRPCFKEKERLKFLSSLNCVDFVGLSNSPDAASDIKRIKPDIYVKGTDVRYKAKNSNNGLYREIKAVKEIGGKVYFIKSLPIHSTKLLNKYFNSPRRR